MNACFPRLLQYALVAALLIPGAAQNTFAQSKSDSAETKRVRMLLTAYDSAPDASKFKRAARDPRKILLALEADPASPEYIKLNALDALSLFPNAQVRARLRAHLASAQGQNPAPRAVHNAINGLLHGWGEQANEEVLALLAHPDIQVRLTIAVAVGTSGGTSGHAALRKHLGGEKDPLVREFIESHAPAQR